MQNRFHPTKQMDIDDSQLTYFFENRKNKSNFDKYIDDKRDINKQCQIHFANPSS